MREKYHLTTQDFETMDWEKIDFFMFFAEAQQREGQRQIDAKAPKPRSR